MQRLMSLKRGSELLKNHSNTTPTIQSICSKTLPHLSKTNPNHLTTFFPTHQLRHFSSHFAAASRSWLPQKNFSEKIYGVVSNPIIVKELLQNTLLKTTGKGLVYSRVGFFKRSFERNPSFEGHLRGWKSWLRRQEANNVILGLVLANVAVFMLWRLADQQFMLKHFTISVDNFKSGRVHTLITSAFSHIDAGHLVSNMIGLYFFGSNIGRVFGPEFVLKLYLAGAVCGSIFYLVHHAFMAPSSKNGRNPSRTPGLGASGAVNAIMLLDMFLFPKSTILVEFIIPVPAILLGIFLIGKDMLRILQVSSESSPGSECRMRFLFEGEHEEDVEASGRKSVSPSLVIKFNFVVIEFDHNIRSYVKIWISMGDDHNEKKGHGDTDGDKKWQQEREFSSDRRWRRWLALLHRWFVNTDYLYWVFLLVTCTNIGTMTKIENDKNRVRVRKQKSGSQNRKVRQRKDSMEKSLIGSISTLFDAKKQKSLLSSQVEEESDEEFGEEDVNDNLRDKEVNEEASGANTGDVHEEPMSEDVDVANEESREGHNEGPTPMNENVGNEEHESVLDLEKDVDVNYDPGLWGSINDSKRIMLVLRGPIKIVRENDAFPKESTRGRHFSSHLYICDLPNGEKQERKWLVYSNELNKVFCFCCKLFKHKTMTTSLAGEGTSDWHNLPTKLRDHERNVEHITNVVREVIRLSLVGKMDKMNQAFEKVKILVGMEVEDELPAEDETSFAFLDDFNRNCTLSTKQRLHGFVICLVAGLTCTLLREATRKILGNEELEAGCCVLTFEKLQPNLLPCFLQSHQVWNNFHLWQFALAGEVRNKLLTLLAIMLEFGALIWYSLSYIPFARSMVSKVMVACFDTEF
ncbi:hypothetical protein RHGRI_024009 [Rhododendron griersonianum]|uniref:Peptidase S54 rhomboid domain-containing protein n=1 Tax=Rhododendron griersonianum TaxID=479676 RepID=A0AAV6J7N2_9ERIC|nr:hypothetical protein RHGRI_024009 [Rhododendron griersonianum]KAG5536433.1 hypothetical protein RHGRI_024009 [Rhododendron griersonianum]